jgi:hypothetical protein
MSQHPFGLGDEFQGFRGFSVQHIGLLEHWQEKEIFAAMVQSRVLNHLFVADKRMRHDAVTLVGQLLAAV